MSETIPPYNTAPTAIGGYGKEFSDIKHSRYDFHSDTKEPVFLKNRTEIRYDPINSSINPYHFQIKTSNRAWLDPQTLQCCGHYRVRDSTGGTTADPAVDQNFSLVNNTPHSLWKNMDVSINGVRFDCPQNMYAQKAYIEVLLNTPNEYKKTVLESTLAWAYDSPHGISTELEPVIKATGTDPTQDYSEEDVEIQDDDGTWKETKVRRKKRKRVPGYNDGYVKRRRGNKTGSWISFRFTPQHDLITTDNVIPPDTQIDLLLFRTSDNFVFLQPKTNLRNYTIEINNLHFIAEVYETKDSILSHHRTLNTRRKPFTKIRRNRMYYFPLVAGRRDVGKPNFFFQKPLPQQIFIAFVDYDGYFGNKHENPFYFKKMEFTEASLFVNGQHVPYEKYSTTTIEGELRCYQKFLLAAGSQPGDPHSVPITFEMYRSNYFFLGWDRTVNQDGGFFGNCYEDEGTIGINLLLETPLAKNMTAIVYASTPERLVYDKEKTKFVDEKSTLI